MASDVFGIVGTTVVGAFQVEAVVAEGGFAVVYRAHHVGFRAPVALKCLKIPQYLAEEDQIRFEQQFQAEAELLFKLSASISTVVRPLHVEAVTAPDGSFMPFLALEWLDGETLHSVARRRRESGQPPFRLDEIVELLDPVARALERAHHFEGPDGPLSIVHRDMKPENIFVASVGGKSVLKILDFGIGKAKSVASQVAGKASQSDDAAAFTPAYGAPEQWSPKQYGQTGPWTDVWGLALTMVELMAGREVVSGDRAAIISTVLHPECRPTPRANGVPVSDAVEAVFEQALALDPRLRFADAGAFWNALLHACSVGDRDHVPAAAPARTALEFDIRELQVDGPAAPAPLHAASLPDLPSVPLRAPGGAMGSRWASPDAPGRADLLSRAAASVSERLPFSLPPDALSLARQLVTPVLLVLGGILITVVDGAYASANGEVFTLGPVRLAWCAGVAVLSGIGLAIHRLLRRERD